MINDDQLDQYPHRISGHPENHTSTPQEPQTIPYYPLPEEILRADGTCHVTVFTAGISVLVTAFIQHENAIDPSNHLTEQEWLERFTKFVKDRGEQREKA